jgi:hypothetical protein
LRDPRKMTVEFCSFHPRPRLLDLILSRTIDEKRGSLTEEPDSREWMI